MKIFVPKVALRLLARPGLIQIQACQAILVPAQIQFAKRRPVALVSRTITGAARTDTLRMALKKPPRRAVNSPLLTRAGTGGQTSLWTNAAPFHDSKKRNARMWAWKITTVVASANGRRLVRMAMSWSGILLARSLTQYQRTRSMFHMCTITLIGIPFVVIGLGTITMRPLRSAGSSGSNLELCKK